MPAYRNKATGKWYASFYYRDFEDNSHQKTKRGFDTREETLLWERKFKEDCNKDMHKSFADFCRNYEEDIRPRIKVNTWESKEHVMRTKILPYFKDMPVDGIRPLDILKWQNGILQMKDSSGKGFSGPYLKAIQSQLSAIFNHAVRYYDLDSNPIKKAGPIGSSRAREVKYWTREEYQVFANTMKENEGFYYAFEILYWCGLRTGEMLALRAEDFDFKNATVSVCKSYQYIKGVEYITKPKTPNSIRTVSLPGTLSERLEEYVKDSSCANGRIFPYNRQWMHKVMRRGIRKAGVQMIRLHDLRHSHVSLLIHLGFSAVDIARRVGHKSERITYYYAHMFPGVQENIANRLDMEMNNDQKGNERLMTSC